MRKLVVLNCAYIYSYHTHLEHSTLVKDCSRAQNAYPFICKAVHSFDSTINPNYCICSTICAALFPVVLNGSSLIFPFLFFFSLRHSSQRQLWSSYFICMLSSVVACYSNSTIFSLNCHVSSNYNYDANRNCAKVIVALLLWVSSVRSMHKHISHLHRESSTFIRQHSFS